MIRYGIQTTSKGSGASVVPRGLTSLPKFPEHEFKKLGVFARRNLRLELDTLAKSLRPVVVAELAANYAKSGVGMRTGTLHRATVTGIMIETYAGGFRVLMQPGVKYADQPRANVYGSAGAKKYGGFRLPGARRLTGTLRKAAQRGHVANVVELKPFPDFFTIDSNGPTARAFETGLKQIFGKVGIKSV